jgi:hypothetical protein
LSCCKESRNGADTLAILKTKPTHDAELESSCFDLASP